MLQAVGMMIDPITKYRSKIWDEGELGARKEWK